MMITENFSPTRTWLLCVRVPDWAPQPPPPPSTHSTHSLANLLSKRTLPAKNNFTPSATHTTTTIIHQTPQTTQHLLLFDTIYISSTNPFTQPGGTPFFLFYFISGSSTAAQNNYLLKEREGTGKERDRTGWDRKGWKRKRNMYGQALGVDGVESLDSLSCFFRFCPPIILWVCSFVFNQFKKSPFLSRSDLCYYTALLYFWARRASCFFSLRFFFLLFATFATIATIPHFQHGIFFSYYSSWAAICLSVTTTTTSPSRREGEGAEHLD